MASSTPMMSSSSIIMCAMVLLSYHTMAYPMFSFRKAAANVQSMNNPNSFMDPSFSAGGTPQGMNMAQTDSKAGQNNLVMAGPPLGSGAQGALNQVQVVNGARGQSQTGTSGNLDYIKTSLAQGGPQNNNNNGNPNTNAIPQGSQTQNAMNRPNAQVSGDLAQSNTNGRPNEGIQQSVSGSYMFNPGKSGSILQAPPGTGNSQFNNNMGSRNSMLNQFGGNGLSVDPSQFFRPKQNPDGSISGAAGNALGPPTNGPMAAMTNGANNSNGKSDNTANTNTQNNFNNGMFGPPNFFMNPGSSFGQK